MSAAPETVIPLKLDLGAGKNKRAGFTAVDVRPFEGVDIVADLTKPWPWADSSVEEVHASHVVEHFTAPERIHFVNELYRVLIPGGKATMITPHWTSCRAYGDLTHQWPPVSEFWFYYLDKNWRAQNAPHNDAYTCDFGCTWGFSPHPSLAVRASEYQQHAMQWWLEARQDMHCQMTARK